MIKHKTHCLKGHEFTPENTFVRTSGYWVCRTCKNTNERNRPRSEKQKETQRIWKQNNPEKVRVTHRRATTQYRFGITPEEYSRRLAEQNNLCALCKETFEGTGAVGLAPALDHSHKNGKLREFIHNSCNKGIGLLRDDPKICRLAAEYLEKHTGD